MFSLCLLGLCLTNLASDFSFTLVKIFNPKRCTRVLVNEKCVIDVFAGLCHIHGGYEEQKYVFRTGKKEKRFFKYSC